MINSFQTQVISRKQIITTVSGKPLYASIFKQPVSTSLKEGDAGPNFQRPKSVLQVFNVETRASFLKEIVLMDIVVGLKFAPLPGKKKSEGDILLLATTSYLEIFRVISGPSKAQDTTFIKESHDSESDSDSSSSSQEDSCRKTMKTRKPRRHQKTHAATQKAPQPSQDIKVSLLQAFELTSHDDEKQSKAPIKIKQIDWFDNQTIVFLAHDGRMYQIHVKY